MSFFGFFLNLASIAFILYILHKYFNGPKTKLSKAMNRKVVIVTGSNIGIGYSTAVELLKKGATVIFACRDEAKTNLAINSIKEPGLKENAQYMKLDLTNFDSIVSFVDEFKRKVGRCDILINNAGAFFDTLNVVNGIEKTFLTNHIGHVVLTAMLLESLNDEGKIINVSSMVYKDISKETFDDYVKDVNFQALGSNYKFWGAYVFSKIANVQHAIHLDAVLSKMNKKVKTASLHPGVVRTEFLGRTVTSTMKILTTLITPIKYIFFKDNFNGAQTTLHICYMDYKDLNSGAFFNNCAEEPLREIASNPANVIKMNELTKQVIMKNMKNIPESVMEYLKY